MKLNWIFLLKLFEGGFDNFYLCDLINNFIFNFEVLGFLNDVYVCVFMFYFLVIGVVRMILKKVVFGYFFCKYISKIYFLF